MHEPDWSALEKKITKMQLGLGRRILLVTLAVVFVLFTSGCIFGYSAFRDAMVEQGVFGDKCPSPEELGCSAQLDSLSLMVTVGASFLNMASIFIGFILDWYGPRVTGTLGALFFLFGTSGMALAYRLQLDKLYIPAFVGISVGGPFIFMSTLHLSSLFPKHSGLIIALLSGAFDASTVVFLIFDKLYRMDRVLGYKMDIFSLFSLFSIVPCGVLVYSMLLMPGKSFMRVPEGNNESAPRNDALDSVVTGETSQRHGESGYLDSEEEEEDLGHVSQQEKASLIPTRKEKLQATWKSPMDNLKDSPLSKQIASSTFVTLLIMTSVYTMRKNFYMVTFLDQLKQLHLSAYQSDILTQTFNILLPLGGALAVIPVGWMLQKLAIHVTFLILVIMMLLFGIFTLIPSVFPIQLIGVLIFSLVRPMFYTCASEFTARVFGFASFGQVYGLLLFGAGLFNFTGAYLEDLARVSGFAPVNIGLTAVTATIGSIFAFYITYLAHFDRKALKQGYQLESGGRNPIISADTSMQEAEDLLITATNR